MELYECHIRVVEAKDLRKVILFGKMDVYAILSCRGETKQSPVAKDGHQTPMFDWKTMLRVTVADTLMLALDHQNSVSSDALIGRCMLPVANFMDGEISDRWVSLATMEGEPAGQVRVRLQMMRAGEKPMRASAAPAAVPTPPQPAASATAGPKAVPVPVLPQAYPPVVQAYPPQQPWVVQPSYQPSHPPVFYPQQPVYPAYPSATLNPYAPQTYPVTYPSVYPPHPIFPTF